MSVGGGGDGGGRLVHASSLRRAHPRRGYALSVLKALGELVGVSESALAALAALGALDNRRLA